MSRSSRDDAAAGYLSGADDTEQLVELEAVVVRPGESEDDAAIRQQLLADCERQAIARIERGQA
jgi:hypothetical protein